MQLDRWEKLNTLFAEARQLDATQRAVYLKVVSDHDPAMAAELESLLSHSDSTNGPLDSRATVNVAACLPPSDQTDPVLGQEIGPFRIEQSIGQGGFGKVYLATRISGFTQTVAIKLLQDHRTQNDVTLRRFQLERQVLADLDHENIAKLLGGGTTSDGRPYLIMEYVEGQNITEYCDTCRIDARERLKLFQKVCDAVAHAHEIGVIHRDIKPCNVLVNQLGVPKLVDFGIAKTTASNADRKCVTLTQEGQLPFTPEYASPEQVKDERIGPPADVYSLGVVLYELLTGVRPYEFSSNSHQELVQVVCEHMPTRPSQMIRRNDCLKYAAEASESPQKPPTPFDSLRGWRQFPSDLDRIVLGSLAKEPERRYASAADLRNDVRCYLEGKPIISRGDSVSYRFSKLIQRNRIASAAATFAILSLLVGFVTTSVAWNKASNAAKQNQEQLYVSDMHLAYEAFHNGQFNEARSLMMRQIPIGVSADLRGIEWGLLHSLTRTIAPTVLPAHEGSINELAHVPGKPWVISVGEDAIARVWNVETGELERTIGPADGPLQSVAVSADGKTIATGCEQVQLWDLNDGEHLSRVRSCSANVESLAFGPKYGELAIGVRYDDVSILSMDDAPVLELQSCARCRHERLQFLGDGQLLVAPFVEDGASYLRIWDCQTHQVIKELRAGHFTHMAVSTDGRWIAATSFVDPTISIYDVESGRRVQSMLRRGDGIVSLAFSPDCKLLAAGCDDGTVAIWHFVVTPPSASPDLEDDLLATVKVDNFQSFRADPSKIRSIVFADNQRLVTGGDDGTLRIWPILPDQGTTSHGPNGNFAASSALPHADFIAGTDSGNVFVKVPDESEWGELNYPVGWFGDVAFTPSGDLLAIGKKDGSIDLLYPKNLKTIGSLVHSDMCAVFEICISPDGRLLASTATDNATCLWDIQSRRLCHRWQHRDNPRQVSFNPTSQLLAIGTSYGEIHVMDIGTNDEVRSIAVNGENRSLAWSPDGQWLAAGQNNGGIVLIELESARVIELHGHLSTVTHAVFSPNGKTLISGSVYGNIRLWHVATGRAMGTLYKPISHTCITGIFFKRNENQLFVTQASSNGTKPIMKWHYQQASRIR